MAVLGCGSRGKMFARMVARRKELGRIVGCDLADPAFWDGGLAIVEQQLEAAESAAFEAGRLS